MIYSGVPGLIAFWPHKPVLVANREYVFASKVSALMMS